MSAENSDLIHKQLLEQIITETQDPQFQIQQLKLAFSAGVDVHSHDGHLFDFTKNKQHTRSVFNKCYYRDFRSAQLVLLDYLASKPLSDRKGVYRQMVATPDSLNFFWDTDVETPEQRSVLVEMYTSSEFSTTTFKMPTNKKVRKHLHLNTKSQK